jgi:hypothetical protein
MLNNSKSLYTGALYSTLSGVVSFSKVPPPDMTGVIGLAALRAVIRWLIFAGSIFSFVAVCT